MPSTLTVPFAAVTDFVDPAVDFSLKFQANGPEEPDDHDAATNDAPVGRTGRGWLECRFGRFHAQEVTGAVASSTKRVST